MRAITSLNCQYTVACFNGQCRRSIHRLCAVGYHGLMPLGKRVHERLAETRKVLGSFMASARVPADGQTLSGDRREGERGAQGLTSLSLWTRLLMPLDIMHTQNISDPS